MENVTQSFIPNLVTELTQWSSPSWEANRF